MALQIGNFGAWNSRGVEQAVGTGGAPTVTATDARFNRCLDLDGFDYVRIQKIPLIGGPASDQGNDYIVGFYCRWTDATPASIQSSFFYMMDAHTTNALELLLNTDGTVSFLAGSLGETHGTTASAVFSDNTWHLVELYFQYATSADWELFVDGDSVMSGTGDNTQRTPPLGDFWLSAEFNDGWKAGDWYFISGASSAADRLSNGADVQNIQVKHYWSTNGLAVPDDGGDNLNVGSWQSMSVNGEGFDAVVSGEYTGTGSGAVNTDDGGGAAGTGGPNTDSDIAADSEIRAVKGTWVMERSGGGGSAHYGLLGNSADGTTRSADFDPPTSKATYEFLSEAATIVPLSTEYGQIGIETTGGQDFECYGQLFEILHVPAAVGGSFVRPHMQRKNIRHMVNR